MYSRLTYNWWFWRFYYPFNSVSVMIQTLEWYLWRIHATVYQRNTKITYGHAPTGYYFSGLTCYSTSLVSHVTLAGTEALTGVSVLVFHWNKSLHVFNCSPNSNSWFSIFPVPINCHCSLVHLILLIPCSPDILANAFVTLFSETPWRASELTAARDRRFRGSVHTTRWLWGPPRNGLVKWRSSKRNRCGPAVVTARQYRKERGTHPWPGWYRCLNRLKNGETG